MTGLRLDKFLWFARFCKSRGLAQGWIAAGEVSVNGVRITKASHAVKIGDIIDMPRGARLRHRIEVTDLGERRGPAPEAAGLYRSLAIGPERDESG